MGAENLLGCCRETWKGESWVELGEMLPCRSLALRDAHLLVFDQLLVGVGVWYKEQH